MLEEDTIYFQLKVDGSVWRIPLHQTDLREKTWDNVTAAMAEQALLEHYPMVFRRSSRVALSANGHCMRQTEILGPYVDMESHLAVVSHGDGPPMRVDPGATADAVPRVETTIIRPEDGQFHGLPDMQNLFRALKLEAESRADRRLRMRIDPHYVRVAQIGAGGPRLLQLPAKATEATGGILERMVKDQLVRRLQNYRAFLVRQNGAIIRQEEIVKFDAEEILWAVVLEPMGGNHDPENVPVIAKDLMKGMHGKTTTQSGQAVVEGGAGALQEVSKAS